MKQATARFRRPANGGVRLGRARSAARLLMFVLLLAALVLLTLAVFYYTRNTAQAMQVGIVYGEADRSVSKNAGIRRADSQQHRLPF